MLALIDCNNFYASCERVFRPDLEGKAIVALSSNDGCVIARSNEAKALGIPMGVPVFKIRSLVKENKVQLFSSNFVLYGDMSARVMATLSNFSAQMEIYSIDEAFLNLGEAKTDTLSLAQNIRNTVKRWTGLPISIGIAPSKTLCKVANYFSKKYASFQGICILEEPEQWLPLLAHMPVQELWGIGRNYAQLMKAKKVESVEDFLQLPATWVQAHMKVMGLRMQQELRGVSCMPLGMLPSARKGICVSRSFGRALRSRDEIAEALSHFASRAAEKLREDNRLTRDLSIFLQTNRFQDNAVSASWHCKLPQLSAYTPDLIRASLNALDKIFQKNLAYKKAGLVLHDLMDANQRQCSFLEEDYTEKDELMKTLDHIHSRWGRDSLRYASDGLHPDWQPRSDLRSPCYTTRWNDLLEIKI